MSLRAPFPSFGGKKQIADRIWRRFGNVPNYIEPFCGSLAVLLARPSNPGAETVNDLNGYLTNAWRSIQMAPEMTAKYANWPVNEVDLHSRGDALFYKWKTLLDSRAMLRCIQDCCHSKSGCPLPETIPEFIKWLEESPTNYCALVGGWWTWGKASWLGSGWDWIEGRGKQQVSRCVPRLTAEQGVHRRTLQLGSNVGVHRKKPRLSHADQRDNLTVYFQVLSNRLRRVRVCCGDWNRVLTPCVVNSKRPPCAIFLDPPYGDPNRNVVYEHDSYNLAKNVLDWCTQNGKDKGMRIAVCGYEGEHNALERLGWDKLAWVAPGGFSNQSDGKNDNRFRERVWFSPGCPHDVKRSPEELARLRAEEFAKRARR